MMVASLIVEGPGKLDIYDIVIAPSKQQRGRLRIEEGASLSSTTLIDARDTDIELVTSSAAALPLSGVTISTAGNMTINGYIYSRNLNVIGNSDWKLDGAVLNIQVSSQAYQPTFTIGGSFTFSDSMIQGYRDYGTYGKAYVAFRPSNGPIVVRSSTISTSIEVSTHILITGGVMARTTTLESGRISFVPCVVAGGCRLIIDTNTTLLTYLRVSNTPPTIHHGDIEMRDGSTLSSSSLNLYSIYNWRVAPSALVQGAVISLSCVRLYLPNLMVLHLPASHTSRRLTILVSGMCSSHGTFHVFNYTQQVLNVFEVI
jgi:hypothetical protein